MVFQELLHRVINIDNRHEDQYRLRTEYIFYMLL